LYFNEVRERYNKYRNPLDFMFLMRTCYNGMPRYNSKGEFNTSFHLNRKGIDPSTLQKIVSEWSILIDLHDVEFRCCSYEKIKPSEKDFMYIDPPYANTKGIYFDDFKNDSMFEWMKNLKCGWALSYDGISGEDNKTYEVPSELYTEHKYIKSGNSSFKRLIQSSSSAVVYESLYVKS
jgi:DNA adenine methylase